MRVLALDLAKLFGWALGSTEGGVESFGRHQLADGPINDLGEYGMIARMTFRRMLDRTAPELVVFEQPILRSGKIKTRGNGKQFVATVDTPDKLRKIYGLPWELCIECLRAGVPVHEANISEVRSFFLMGPVPKTSEECKIAVKVMCRRRGWNIVDDNEADALAVLTWKLSKIDPSAQTVLNLRAGESARVSSSGLDAFARSTTPSRPLSKTAAPARPTSSSAGAGDASSTAQESPGKTTAIIRRSGAVMSSISSASQRTLDLRDPDELSRRRARR